MTGSVNQKKGLAIAAIQVAEEHDTYFHEEGL